jgi:hypothetical protein
MAPAFTAVVLLLLHADDHHDWWCGVCMLAVTLQESSTQQTAWDTNSDKGASQQLAG